MVSLRGIKFTSYVPESVGGSITPTVRPESARSFINSRCICAKRLVGLFGLRFEFVDRFGIGRISNVIGLQVFVCRGETLETGVLSHLSHPLGGQGRLEVEPYHRRVERAILIDMPYLSPFRGRGANVDLFLIEVLGEPDQCRQDPGAVAFFEGYTQSERRLHLLAVKADGGGVFDLEGLDALGQVSERIAGDLLQQKRSGSVPGRRRVDQVGQAWEFPPRLLARRRRSQV